MSAKTQFCWYAKGFGETVYGPFGSIEDAKQDAIRENDGNGWEIVIADVLRPDPKKYVDCLDVDEVLELMEERLVDDEEVAADGPVFEVDDAEQAAKDLFFLLKCWAAIHVRNGGQWFAGKDVETFQPETAEKK